MPLDLVVSLGLKLSGIRFFRLRGFFLGRLLSSSLALLEEGSPKGSRERLLNSVEEKSIVGTVSNSKFSRSKPIRSKLSYLVYRNSVILDSPS